MSHERDVVALTYFGFNVNAAIDEGKGTDLEFDEIYASLERGTLLADLDRRYPDAFDFSPYEADGDRETRLIELLHNATGGIENRERRKTGVEHNGLCLLVALVFEALQVLH
jgi:hypothetical protein